MKGDVEYYFTIYCVVNSVMDILFVEATV